MKNAYREPFLKTYKQKTLTVSEQYVGLGGGVEMKKKSQTEMWWYTHTQIPPAPFFRQIPGSPRPQIWWRFLATTYLRKRFLWSKAGLSIGKSSTWIFHSIRFYTKAYFWGILSGYALVEKSRLGFPSLRKIFPSRIIKLLQEFEAMITRKKSNIQAIPQKVLFVYRKWIWK